MTPKRNRYSPFIPREAYHDALNMIQAQNSIQIDRDEDLEPQELDFDGDALNEIEDLNDPGESFHIAKSAPTKIP